MKMPEKIFVMGGGYKHKEFLLAVQDEKQVFEPTEYRREDLPKEVDIQDLKRKDLSPFDSFGMSVEERYARRLKKEGWNDCLDHLVALGVIINVKPAENKGE